MYEFRSVRSRTLTDYVGKVAPIMNRTFSGMSVFWGIRIKSIDGNKLLLYSSTTTDIRM